MWGPGTTQFQLPPQSQRGQQPAYTPVLIQRPGPVHEQLTRQAAPAGPAGVRGADRGAPARPCWPRLLITVLHGASLHSQPSREWEFLLHNSSDNTQGCEIVLVFANLVSSNSTTCGFYYWGSAGIPLVTDHLDFLF